MLRQAWVLGWGPRPGEAGPQFWRNWELGRGFALLLTDKNGYRSILFRDPQNDLDTDFASTWCLSGVCVCRSGQCSVTTTW